MSLQHSTTQPRRAPLAARALGLLLAVAALACAQDEDTSDEPETAAPTIEQHDQALAQRCSVFGDPPVTVGCAEGSICRIEACTNSIPPSCFGTCAKPRAKDAGLGF